MAGLGRAIIETELKKTSLSENDQRIIADLIRRNNAEIEKYIKENAPKQVVKSMVNDLKKRGMKF